MGDDVITKKEFWDALKHPHNVHRSCWNCVHQDETNRWKRVCAKPGIGVRIKTKCRNAKDKKKKYWEWDGTD